MIALWIFFCALFTALAVIVIDDLRKREPRIVELKGTRDGNDWQFRVPDGAFDEEGLFWLAALDPEHEG